MKNKYDIYSSKNKEIENLIKAGKSENTYKTKSAEDVLKELGGNKIKKSTLSVKVFEDLDKMFNKICSKKKEKPNVLVEVILKNLYDDNKKTFNIDIGKKIKPKDRPTSFHIDEKYINAIKNSSKKLNMSSTEYFNKLMIKFIVDNNLMENL